MHINKWKIFNQFNLNLQKETMAFITIFTTISLIVKWNICLTIYLYPASRYGPNSYLSESLSCNNNSNWYSLVLLETKYANMYYFEENYQMFCYLQLAYKWRQYVPGLGSGKGLFFWLLNSVWESWQKLFPAIIDRVTSWIYTEMSDARGKSLWKSSWHEPIKTNSSNLNNRCTRDFSPKYIW